MIYLDNAATTYPKPDVVYEKMDWANRKLSVNAGRGSYKISKQAADLIEDTRKKLVDVVKGKNGECAVITSSATSALQIILHGIDFEEGDVIYLSPYEHNAVARNVEAIRKSQKIVVEMIPLIEETLEIDIDKFKYMVSRKKPKCVCCTHVSNVTGYILPVPEIFQIAKVYNAITILDASQSFGLIDINSATYNADFIVFAGHKTLYGPFGASGFIDVSHIDLKPILVGGTGSDSLNLDMPGKSPERYESSSKNIVAIAGLNAALSELDIAKTYNHEKELSMYAISKLEEMDGITLHVPGDLDNHIGVISFTIDGYKSEDVGMILDEDFDIAVRTGYHCAPYIHDFLDDKNSLGTVRIGLSQFSTVEEIDRLMDAILEFE